MFCKAWGTVTSQLWCIIDPPKGNQWNCEFDSLRVPQSQFCFNGYLSLFHSKPSLSACIYKGVRFVDKHWHWSYCCFVYSILNSSKVNHFIQILIPNANQSSRTLEFHINIFQLYDWNHLGFIDHAAYIVLESRTDWLKPWENLVHIL